MKILKKRGPLARLAALFALAALATAPATVQAAPFGENYDLVPINGGPGSETLDVPALPGLDRLFWAGTCDRGAAPLAGGDLGTLGGVGTMPSTATAPDAMFGFLANIVNVPLLGSVRDCIDWRLGLSSFNPIAGSSQPHDLWQPAPNWRLPDVTQAGAHADGTATFGFIADGDPDNIIVELPPGFVGDPTAVTRCTAEQFAVKPQQCPPSSQVGVLTLRYNAPPGGVNFGPLHGVETLPIYNLEPRQGNPAELGIAAVTIDGRITVRLIAKPRTNSDFGITTFVGQLPGSALPVLQQQVTLWGVPWAVHNDVWRGPVGTGNIFGSCTFQPGTEVGHPIPPGGLSPACRESYEPSWGPIKPFISLETECNPGPVTRFYSDNYQFPGSLVPDGSKAPEGALTARNGNPDTSDPDWVIGSAEAPPVLGCEKLPFDPDIALDPKGPGGAPVHSADSPAGLDVELNVPQNDELPFVAPSDGAPQPEVEQYLADATAFWSSDQGLAASHLRDTTVTLPAGMTLNPSAADGQGACSMEQIGVTDVDSPEPPGIRFDNSPIACPDSSKVGDVVIETPLLAEADWPTGSVYLAKQGANPFGSDFAIYIGVTSPDRGVIVKLAGKVTPDPITGQLTTTFVDNPELPFDTFRLRFKPGPRAPLATPVTCGTHASSNVLTPYSSPDKPVSVSVPLEVTSSPAGGCPASPEQRPFNVGFAAGSTELVAGANSPFTMRITRPDGNQELDRIELTTPEGLAAKLAGVPYCPEAGIARAIGRTATGDGAKEQADPSCPASSKVGTTTIGAGAGNQPFFVKGDVFLAGPYKGAPVSLAFVVPAVAGPFDLGVQVVRTALNVNPKTAQVTAVSDTIPKILRGIPLRIRDVRVDIDRPGFIVNPTDCSEMAVSGVVVGASGAVTNVSNRFQIAECARLGFKPKLRLQLFGGTARGKYQALKATVTARPGDANIARAAVTLPQSSFLAQEHIRTVCTRVQFAADQCPSGSVYGKATAVSPLLDQPLSGPVYLRSSSNTLPDLVAALKGPDSQPIEVELSGRTDSKNRGIRNTFDIVPDAPVSKFTLELLGGKRSLIVNSTNICKGVHKATVKFGAQNGRKHNFQTKVTNPACKKGKKGKKGAKKRGSD